jgi:hypothetical protein
MSSADDMAIVARERRKFPDIMKGRVAEALFIRRDDVTTTANRLCGDQRVDGLRPVTIAKPASMSPPPPSAKNLRLKLSSWARRKSATV